MTHEAYDIWIPNRNDRRQQTGTKHSVSLKTNKNLSRLAQKKGDEIIFFFFSFFLFEGRDFSCCFLSLDTCISTVRKMFNRNQNAYFISRVKREKNGKWMIFFCKRNSVTCFIIFWVDLLDYTHNRYPVKRKINKETVKLFIFLQKPIFEIRILERFSKHSGRGMFFWYWLERNLEAFWYFGSKWLQMVHFTDLF